MCFMKAPKIPPPPVAPRLEDAFSAGNRELLKRAGAKSYASTIMGGALGSSENLTPKKTLLGA
jgi:hypothetical protein